MRLPYAAINGIDAGARLRYHAAVNDLPLYKLLRLVRLERIIQRSRIFPVPQDTFDVRKEDELLGIERYGDLARHVIGIDIIDMAVPAHSQRIYDRYDIVLYEPFDDRRIDRRHLSDITEVDIAFHAPDSDKVILPAAHAECLASHRLERIDDLTIYGGERPLDDMQRRRIRIPAAAYEFRFNAGLLHHLRYVRPSAMHDDRPHPRILHEHDIFQYAGIEPFLVNSRAAVLYYDRLLVELLNIRKRLDQDFALFNGFLHVEYSELIATYSFEKSQVHALAEDLPLFRSTLILTDLPLKNFLALSLLNVLAIAPLESAFTGPR